ncbi:MULTISPECIES: S1/P1 nuclease [unclassified Phenylobacterium]|uniref:S1/P1 nuclease n=1 Tax=unclassified Phenylobacterium TaxID=2640670 RepID=UPI00083B306F|nr:MULTISPECIES: S1/P1 nuclease [unclassified Phenylobacterium]
MRLLTMILFGLAIGAAHLLAPSPAKAWGALGHLTVCDLAYRNLTPTARAALNELLQSRRGGTVVQSRDGVELRRYTSFNLGCLEEDARPRKHASDHFINVDRTVPAITASACPGTGSCILEGIRRDLSTLKDATKSREDRVFALMAVGHWIGDIHQPLHVSFKDDAGGNGIEVSVAGGCSGGSRPKNLHSVWDNCLLQAGMFQRVRLRADFKSTWGPNTITYRAVDTLLANTTVTEERSLVAGDPTNWADESYQITITPAALYCAPAGGTCVSGAPPTGKLRIDQAYLRAFDRIAQDRVRLAGFRLAHLLNLALDPDYTQPIQNSTQNP